MHLFVFGLGYSARAVVTRLRPRLAAAWGTTRDPEKLAEIEALGATPLLFDAVASPPPLRGRDREGGHAERQPLAFPPPLATRGRGTS